MGFTSNSPREVDKILLEHLVSDDRDKLPSWLIPRHEELKWEARHAIANRLRYLRKIQERADHKSFVALCNEHDVTPGYCGIPESDGPAGDGGARRPGDNDEVSGSTAGASAPAKASRRKKIPLASRDRGGGQKKRTIAADMDDGDDLDHDAELLGLKKRKLVADAKCKEAECKQKEFEMKLTELEYKKVLLAQYEALKAEPDEWSNARIAKAFPEMVQFFG